MPTITPPPLACDAHMHVFDARFPHSGTMVNDATAEVYRREFQARIGTTRTVVVTPRIFGVDNRVTLDAIRQLGAARTRGVAVLRPDVTDAELVTLHAGGIRGIRFTLYTPAQAVLGFGMGESLSQRVNELCWQVQVRLAAAQIVDHAAFPEIPP